MDFNQSMSWLARVAGFVQFCKDQDGRTVVVVQAPGAPGYRSAPHTRRAVATPGAEGLDVLQLVRQLASDETLNRELATSGEVPS